MKTLILSLAVGAIIGGVTGMVMTPKNEKLYSASFSFDIPPMLVAYSSAEEAGTIESWVHCGKCKQGVIRENGKCSFCQSHEKQ